MLSQRAYIRVCVRGWVVGILRELGAARGSGLGVGLEVVRGLAGAALRGSCAGQAQDSAVEEEGQKVSATTRRASNG